MTQKKMYEFTCNRCYVTDEQDEFGNLPIGWITVEVKGAANPAKKARRMRPARPSTEEYHVCEECKHEFLALFDPANAKVNGDNASLINIKEGSREPEGGTIAGGVNQTRTVHATWPTPKTCVHHVLLSDFCEACLTGAEA